MADADLVAELRVEAAENAGEDETTGDLTAAAVIDDHVASLGWQNLARRFGPVLFQQYPASVLGHMAEEFYRLGLIAHLSGSKPLRQAARSQPEFLAQTLKADEVSGTHRSFLAMLLQVLDDEPLVVLHVEERKGFNIRIGGIADNFQFHTLLAGAIIGPAAQGLVTGEAPSKKAVAQCRDAAVGAGGGAEVTGAFNLWNWTALKPDGRLPEGQTTAATDHWIWNEGYPAEIEPFEGRRFVLVGPPPYLRHWRAGRAFHGMAGELTVERKLSEEEVSDLLKRLARAAKA